MQWKRAIRNIQVELVSQLHCERHTWANEEINYGTRAIAEGQFVRPSYKTQKHYKQSWRDLTAATTLEWSGLPGPGRTMLEKLREDVEPDCNYKAKRYNKVRPKVIKRKPEYQLGYIPHLPQKGQELHLKEGGTKKHCCPGCFEKCFYACLIGN